MDITIMNLGQTFDSWRYNDLPEEEVAQHLDIINALWDELLTRKASLNNN
jgi:hypothetical protein